MVLFVSPLLWIYLSVRQNSALGGQISTLAFVASLATVLFIAVSPQYWLSAIVYREKNRILDQLARDILSNQNRTETEGVRDWQQLESRVNVYQAINASPISVVDLQTLAKYGLAVLTTAMPYLVEWLL